MGNMYNAQEVLNRIEKALKQKYYKKPVESVCDQFNIFDWWKDYLTASHLKQMRTFLREAIKLGYIGHVSFKLGATNCSNGMWAFKEQSADEYSPEGPALYRSFTPEYTYWDITKLNGSWKWDKSIKQYNTLKSIKDLEAFIEAHSDEVYHV